MNYSRNSFIRRYILSVVFWIGTFLLGSVVTWVRSRFGDVPIERGPFSEFVPLTDPGLFALWLVTMVPLTAVIFKRSEKEGER